MCVDFGNSKCFKSSVTQNLAVGNPEGRGTSEILPSSEFKRLPYIHLGFLVLQEVCVICSKIIDHERKVGS